VSTVVVNMRGGAPCDVYIGRPGKWGNPFKVGRDGTLVPERQAVESLEPHDNETYGNRSRDIFPPSLIKQVGWERAQSRSERP
jgi:hypothetical protein